MFPSSPIPAMPFAPNNDPPDAPGGSDDSSGNSSSSSDSSDGDNHRPGELPDSRDRDSALEKHGVEVRRQATLLKTGALQDAIFNSANFSSIATDERGVIQIFNVGAERMLGYAAAEVVNRITPADISDPQELIARAKSLSVELDAAITPGFEALVFKASRGIEDIYELTYIRRDGSRFPAIVSVTALRDVQEKIIGYLLIGTDNTARKQIEEARTLLDQRLRDQQFYTRSLIESSIDALMTTDPLGIISDVNEQMIALTGRTRDELIGAPCKNFFTDPDQADAAIKRVLIENKIRNYELTMRSLDGEETVVSYNAVTFHDRDRNLKGVFASARDVTEHKRFERTLQEKNIELEHASRMKSAFLATMSHELRTPLNAIIGFSEALQEGLAGRITDTQREYIGDIFTSGQHLLSLINDILDLSKVEAGRLEIEHAPLSIAGVIEDTCGMLDQLALRNGVEFILFIDPAIPERTLGDALRLRQVMLNLISNAIKFSSGREFPGRVTVRALLVARNEDDILVDIHVGDNGIGMDEDTKAMLFTAFSQADASTTRRYGGTGLGLAISRHLLHLMDGQVTLQSSTTEGHSGSTFSVRLRCALPPTGPQDGGSRRRGPHEITEGSGDGAAATGAGDDLRFATPPVSLARADIRGLSCVVVGGANGLAPGIASYLRADGAEVCGAVDLAAAERLLRTAAPGPWICIVDAGDVIAPSDALQTLATRLPGQQIGFLCVERGARRQPLRENEHLVLVDGNVLTRQRLARSVAMAAGRAASSMPPSAGAGIGQPGGLLQPPPSQADAQRDGKLILVAEDNETNQKVILRQLALLGYTAHVAANGALALEYLQRYHYGLLLTDLHMPEMDGYELTAAIRNREYGRQHLPILALTASALLGEGERCRQAGMDGYLCKPLQLMDLKNALQVWLPGTVASRQLIATGADGAGDGRGGNGGVHDGADGNAGNDGYDADAAADFRAAVETMNAQTVYTRTVNVSILENLIGNEPAVIDEFLQHFQLCARKIAEALRVACAGRHAIEAGDQAHKLKASALTVGALLLGARCGELEIAGRSDDMDGVTMLLPGFEKEFAAVNLMLDQMGADYRQRQHGV